MVGVGRKKIFFNLINYELEKKSSEVGKMAFLAVILAKFKFAQTSPYQPTW